MKYIMKQKFGIWLQTDIESGVNDINYRDTFLSTYNLLKIAKEFQIKSFSLHQVQLFMVTMEINCK